MWQILNAVAAKWMLVFLLALIIWVCIKAFSGKLKNRMSTKLLLSLVALWLVSVGSFIVMGAQQPDGGSDMLAFKTYSLAGNVSLAVFLCSLGLFSKQR